MTKINKTKWIDIGRPESLADVVGHPDVVSAIEAKLSTGSRQSILLYGPAGTGKTSLAYIIAREILGDVKLMLDINASKDNGVGVVREIIAPRVRNSSFDGSPHVVFLDEADNMTPQAQEALRRVMDDYGKNAIFIIATNDLSAIIDPIQSRCAGSTYMLDTLSADSLDTLLRNVLVKVCDSTIVTDSAVEDLSLIGMSAHGDARAAVDMLQSWYENGMTTGAFSVEHRFEDFVQKVFTNRTADPFEILPTVEEKDLSRLFKFITDTNKFSRSQLEHIAGIFARTDMAMQRSHNKDIHLINMIYTLAGEV